MQKKINRRTAIQAGAGAAFAVAVSGALPHGALAQTVGTSGTVNGLASKKEILTLAQALRKHSAALAQAQSDYKTSVVAVNALVTSVLTSQLPTLNNYPPDWSSFTTAYEQATADALDWVNTVMARLLEVPDDVISYNDTINLLLQDASQQASTLITNPNNLAALAVLKQDLNALSGQFKLVTTFITGAITNIKKFQDKLPTITSQLQTIAQQSVTDANVDQHQIDQLNAAISQLQNDINTLTATIVGLAITDAAALTIGTVATIALWPLGAAVWFVLGPAVAVATTYIALDTEQIKADQAAIQQAQQQITGLTSDVATLQILTNNYASMANQAEQVQANLTTVLTEWQTLETDVNVAITDVNAALSDTTANHFQAVANDLSQAVTEWGIAYAQVSGLDIQLNVNNAQLTLGMSSNDVQAVLATGQTMDVIDYYNVLSDLAA